MSEINDTFHQFAAAFAGTHVDAEPICFPKNLARDQLDLSLASLKLVDKYLSFLHDNNEVLDDEKWHNTVMYGGAYVGEVIRRETQSHFEWIDYDDYMPSHPDLRAMMPQRTTPTCAFLVDKHGAMSMPLNKVARFIDEGDENSVHFFAQCDIAKAAGT